MSDKQPKFHFERDIDLTNPPLVEAWIEIRWKLEPGEPPQMKDPGFLFALGPFYEQIKENYPIRESLPSVNIPEALTPHTVRYQFINKDHSALFQLGPGVATVNILNNYSRQAFFRLIGILRSSLLEAYQVESLQTETVILRYRNVEPFDYTSNNVLDFIRGKLNTSIELPAHIPGQHSLDIPGSTDLNLSFNLLNPVGTGRIRIVTGTKNSDESDVSTDKVILWELGVSSGGENVPPIDNEDVFNEWLEAANAVIHEWFFSLVTGTLLEQYR